MLRSSAASEAFVSAVAQNPEEFAHEAFDRRQGRFADAAHPRFRDARRQVAHGSLECRDGGARRKVHEGARHRRDFAADVGDAVLVAGRHGRVAGRDFRAHRFDAVRQRIDVALEAGDIWRGYRVGLACRVPLHPVDQRRQAHFKRVWHRFGRTDRAHRNFDRRVWIVQFFLAPRDFRDGGRERTLRRGPPINLVARRPAQAGRRSGAAFVTTMLRHRIEATLEARQGVVHMRIGHDGLHGLRRRRSLLGFRCRHADRRGMARETDDALLESSKRVAHLRVRRRRCRRGVLDPLLDVAQPLGDRGEGLVVAIPIALAGVDEFRDLRESADRPLAAAVGAAIEGGDRIFQQSLGVEVGPGLRRAPGRAPVARQRPFVATQIVATQIATQIVATQVATQDRCDPIR